LKKFEKGTRWDQGMATGAPAFTGEIKLRKKFSEQDVKREGGSNLTGEDVYELDFSAFKDEGLYCIQIPGLGRSWPFQVTKDGYGAAFYTMMKGLYTQRCGTELKKPFSAWERPACHTETKKGEFIPETNNWYSTGYRNGAPNQDEVGFRNASGQRIGLAQFTLIGNANPDAPVMPSVKGGWHDAADFDRRIAFSFGALIFV
ncbi:glycoside hydrolase family 9 protein, partial [bacterium]|nr:glycoside hydrolase family 9 protein [bacterium]